MHLFLQQDEHTNASACACLSAAPTTGKAMLLQAPHDSMSTITAIHSKLPLLPTSCKMLLTHNITVQSSWFVTGNPQDVAPLCLVKCKSMMHDSTASCHLGYSHVPCCNLSMMASRSSTWCTSRSRMAAISLTLRLCRLLGHHRQYPYTTTNVAADMAMEVYTIGQNMSGVSCMSGGHSQQPRGYSEASRYAVSESLKK